MTQDWKPWKIALKSSLLEIKGNAGEGGPEKLKPPKGTSETSTKSRIKIIASQVNWGEGEGVTQGFFKSKKWQKKQFLPS